MFKSVQSLSAGHDEIVTGKRCVWFVCVLVINVIKVVKDVVPIQDIISVFTFRQMFSDRTFLWIRVFR